MGLEGLRLWEDRLADLPGGSPGILRDNRDAGRDTLDVRVEVDQGGRPDARVGASDPGEGAGTGRSLLALKEGILGNAGAEGAGIDLREVRTAHAVGVGNLGLGEGGNHLRWGEVGSLGAGEGELEN